MYQVSLHIDFALNIHLKKVYHGISSLSMIKTLYICNITFNTLFNDTKHLIVAGIHADITYQKATASFPEELSQVSSYAIFRESFLASWVKVPFPFTYVYEGDDVYKHLLRAISPDDHSIPQGLPNYNLFHTTCFDFAKSLFNMSTPIGPSAPKASILRNGTFLPMLKIAHKSLISLTSNVPTNTKARNGFIINILRKSLIIFKIHFFLAPKPKTHTAGAPNTKPIFNSWGDLRGKDKEKSSLPSSDGPSSRPIINPATVAFNNAIAEDWNADWSINALTLNNLKSFLCKTSLPTNFVIPTLTDIKYVNGTYLWVKANYNGIRPLYHLALLVTIIITSSLLPNLFMLQGLGNQFQDAKSKDNIYKIFDDIDWISKSKKGMAERSIFIGMFTTFIIAIYEKNSPLRKHMDLAKRRGLDDHWTIKHC